MDHNPIRQPSMALRKHGPKTLQVEHDFYPRFLNKHHAYQTLVLVVFVFPSLFRRMANIPQHILIQPTTAIDYPVMILDQAD